MTFWELRAVLPCKCGHSQEMHEHYRYGSDCGACGKVECPRYRREWSKNPDGI